MNQYLSRSVLNTQRNNVYHYAEYKYAGLGVKIQWRYDGCNYYDCHSTRCCTQCNYPECRGGIKSSPLTNTWAFLPEHQWQSKKKLLMITGHSCLTTSPDVSLSSSKSLNSRRTSFRSDSPSASPASKKGLQRWILMV